MARPASATEEGWRPAAFNQGWTYHDRIRPQESGQPLSAVMARRHRHSSPSLWQHRLAAGQLCRNDQPLCSDVTLQVGDRISWRRPPWLEPAVPMHWSVLHDDGDLLVLNKPSGLPVMPAGGFLMHTLTAMLDEHSRGMGEVDAPRPVHRLGRYTSGLQVCARHPQTRAHLSRQFCPTGGCRKLYQAWSQRVPGLESGRPLVVSTDVVERPHPLLGWVWGPEPRPGELERRRLSARSELMLLERTPRGDRLQVSITTGRPHQIRIHLAQLGSPLLGDPLFLEERAIAESVTPGEGGYSLHAWHLEGLRDQASRPIRLEAPLPPAFAPAPD